MSLRILTKSDYIFYFVSGIETAGLLFLGLLLRCVYDAKLGGRNAMYQTDSGVWYVKWSQENIYRNGS